VHAALESLTARVVKHADAQRVLVRITRDGDTVEVLLRDDGTQSMPPD